MWRVLVLVFSLLSLNVALILASAHGSLAASFHASTQSSFESAIGEQAYLAAPSVGENAPGGSINGCVPACLVHAAIEPSIWSEDPVSSTRKLRLFPAHLVLSGTTPLLQKRPPKSAAA